MVKTTQQSMGSSSTDAVLSIKGMRIRTYLLDLPNDLEHVDEKVADLILRFERVNIDIDDQVHKLSGFGQFEIRESYILPEMLSDYERVVNSKLSYLGQLKSEGSGEWHDVFLKHDDKSICYLGDAFTLEGSDAMYLLAKSMQHFLDGLYNIEHLATID